MGMRCGKIGIEAAEFIEKPVNELRSVCVNGFCKSRIASVGWFATSSHYGRIMTPNKSILFVKNARFLNFNVTPAFLKNLRTFRVWFMCSRGVCRKISILSKSTGANFHLTENIMMCMTCWKLAGQTLNQMANKRIGITCSKKWTLLSHGRKGALQPPNDCSLRRELKILLRPQRSLWTHAFMAVDTNFVRMRRWVCCNQCRISKFCSFSLQIPLARPIPFERFRRHSVPTCRRSPIVGGHGRLLQHNIVPMYPAYIWPP